MLLEILLATIIVSLVSLVGIVLLSFGKTVMDELVFVILSFATGALLATAFFDLFPEAMEGIDLEVTFTAALAGILVMFILERLVHWHHEHHDHLKHEKPVAYLVLVGDGIHNFFDGVAIAASFLTSMEVGIMTTVAIILHEIPQELSDFTLLIYAGFTNKKAIMMNLLVAFTAVLGALAFWFLAGHIEKLQYYGLAFTAGTFIYISCTDLLPELHKEEQKKKSVVQLFAMLLGIALIWFLIRNISG